jgi:hypothetical protein
MENSVEYATLGNTGHLSHHRRDLIQRVAFLKSLLEGIGRMAMVSRSRCLRIRR